MLQIIYRVYVELGNYSKSSRPFEGADLEGANLGAYCYGAFFVKATLEGTIFDGAYLTYTYFDENDDQYDDVSYDAGAESGDLNLDGADDVLDVVLLVNNILNP